MTARHLSATKETTPDDTRRCSFNSHFLSQTQEWILAHDARVLYAPGFHRPSACQDPLASQTVATVLIGTRPIARAVFQEFSPYRRCGAAPIASRLLAASVWRRSLLRRRRISRSPLRSRLLVLEFQDAFAASGRSPRFPAASPA